MATVSFELKGAAKLFKILNKLEVKIATQRMMSQIGNYLMTSIKQRTGKGKDVEGELFQPYSTGHKKLRAAKGLPTNIVDLFFSGSMMSAMTFDAGSEQVQLFFMATSDRTGTKNPAKAYFLDQKRQFFSISKSEIGEVEEIAAEAVEEILDGYK